MSDCAHQRVVPDEEAGPGSEEDHEVPATLQTQVSLSGVDSYFLLAAPQIKAASGFSAGSKS